MGDFSNVSTRRAAGPYICDEGGCAIRQGDAYVRMFGVVEGHSYSFKFCRRCWDMRVEAWLAFDCDEERGFNPGELKTWLAEEHGIADVESWFAARRAERAAAERQISDKEPAGKVCGQRGHDLKCWPAYFGATTLGLKPFDVRRHDRDFQVGDLVLLCEFDPLKGDLTGRRTFRVVTYVLPGGSFGIEPGFCVLGLGRC